MFSLYSRVQDILDGSVAAVGIRAAPAEIPQSRRAIGGLRNKIVESRDPVNVEMITFDLS